MADGDDYGDEFDAMYDRFEEVWDGDYATLREQAANWLGDHYNDTAWDAIAERASAAITESVESYGLGAEPDPFAGTVTIHTERGAIETSGVIEREVHFKWGDMLQLIDQDTGRIISNRRI